MPVRVGQKVEQGQVIAYASCTGTGYYHVHFEVNIDGHRGAMENAPDYFFSSVPTPFVEITNRKYGIPHSGDYYTSQNVQIVSTEQPVFGDHTGGIRISVQPNPFRSSASILVRGAGSAGLERIAVYDLAGRLVDLLLSPGESTVWNAGGRASGVYVFEAVKGGEKASVRARIRR